VHRRRQLGLEQRAEEERVAGPGVTWIVPSSPTSEQASGAISSGSPASPYSACAAPTRPAAERANSSSACWKPPQVPRNGTPPSRAERTARSAPSRLR
jgi:hypothetical protein